MRPNENIKDQMRANRGADASLRPPATTSLASSEETCVSGEIENNSTPRRKGAMRSQVSDSYNPLGAITTIQIRRIVAGLEAGHSERKIAQAEGLDEAAIRRVRAAELDRRNRQMSAVGIAFSDLLENVRILHRDIDEAVFEELREHAA